MTQRTAQQTQVELTYLQFLLVNIEVRESEKKFL